MNLLLDFLSIRCRDCLVTHQQEVSQRRPLTEQGILCVSQCVALCTIEDFGLDSLKAVMVLLPLEQHGEKMK